MEVTESSEKFKSSGYNYKDKDSDIQLVFEEPEVHMSCLWVSSLFKGE